MDAASAHVLAALGTLSQVLGTGRLPMLKSRTAEPAGRLERGVVQDRHGEKGMLARFSAKKKARAAQSGTGGGMG